MNYSRAENTNKQSDVLGKKKNAWEEAVGGGGGGGGGGGALSKISNSSFKNFSTKFLLLLSFFPFDLVFFNSFFFWLF